MKLTPLDIRRQEFKRVVRGVDPEEVSVFLDMVAGEYERVLRDNKTLGDELEGLRRKVEEFDGMKEAIQGAVVMAKKGADDALNQAKKEAELKLKEAEVKAERLLDDARREAAMFRKEINDIRNQRSILISRMKSLLDGQMRMLEAYVGDWEEESREMHLASGASHEARTPGRGAVAGAPRWVGRPQPSKVQWDGELAESTDLKAGDDTDEVIEQGVAEGGEEMAEADWPEAPAESAAETDAGQADERPRTMAMSDSSGRAGQEDDAGLDESTRAARRTDFIRFLRGGASFRPGPLRSLDDSEQVHEPRPPRPILERQTAGTAKATQRADAASGQAAARKPGAVTPEREG